MESTKVRKSRRNVVAGALLATGIATASLAVVTPAQAATFDQAFAACANGATCLWRDANFVTALGLYNFVSYHLMIPNFNQWNYAGTTYNAGNSVSSFVNDGNVETTYLFGGTYQQGAFYTPVPIKAGVSSLNGPGIGGNDDIESGYFASCLDGIC